MQASLAQAMPSVQQRLHALETAAEDRELTPVAWWIGTAHVDEVTQALVADEDVTVDTDGGRLAAIDDREVKVLTESPERFALWCEEGALDL
jgi:hypothetical protein